MCKMSLLNCVYQKLMSKTKTYWKGYSEKHQTPDFVSSSNKEFQEKIPVGEFLSSDDATDLKSGRRDFLKFLGFSVRGLTEAIGPF